MNWQQPINDTRIRKGQFLAKVNEYDKNILKQAKQLLFMELENEKSTSPTEKKMQKYK